MKRKFVVAIAAACAVAMIAAVPAVAAVVASMQVSQTKGYYGQETMLLPSVDTTAVPGATFTMETSKSGSTWEMIGENQGIEDTGTVDPFYHIWDNTLSYPAYFRVAYRSKGTTMGQEPTAVTEPVQLSALKYLGTRVKMTGAKSAKARKTYKVAVQVSPECGEGIVKVNRYKRSGGRWVFVKSHLIETDEVGAGTLMLKPGMRGEYLLRAKFLGNQFGVASPYASKSYVVR
jgi:hypothetical protein